MKTRITELLNIEHPIIQGGMHYVGFAELAAAVSNAGGLGIITGLTQKTPAALDYPAIIKTIIQGGVKIVETAGNNPSQVLPYLQDAGIKEVHKCTSERHARKAQSIGCDAASVDGFECGGHPGEDDVPNMILLPRAADELEIPFVASGGQADGRSLVASPAMGADGMNMGTRFIASAEAHAAQSYKETVVGAGDTDTTRTRCYSGKPMRCRTNDYILDWESRPNEIQQFPMQAVLSVQTDVIGGIGGVTDEARLDGTKSCFAMGQSAGGVKDILPVKDIVDRIMEEAEAAITRVSSLRVSETV